MNREPQIQEDVQGHEGSGPPNVAVPPERAEIKVVLLTGGSDRPYVYGLTTALGALGAKMDLIASDELDEPDLRRKPGVDFLNLRGDQRPDAAFADKIFRVLEYYFKLIRYAATCEAKLFHILWNSRFEVFDRTLLTLYFKLLGKRILLTVHNVNKRKRDARDTYINRLTLRIQYRLADHIFVHTEKMKSELVGDFGVPAARVTVIPFGINDSVPNTNLSTLEAKERLGICRTKKTILFFGRIKRYKGLEYLVSAFRQLQSQRDDYRLIIAGRMEEDFESYWRPIWETISEDVKTGRVVLRTEFVPDTDTEIYFKAADVLALPYKDIFQSGVLFLAYSFGLPVLAADVGSLKDEITEGKTGFVFRPGDPADLATAIERYFTSDLFANLATWRQQIRDFATERHSWDVVGQITTKVYSDLLRLSSAKERATPESSKASLEARVPE